VIRDRLYADDLARDRTVPPAGRAELELQSRSDAPMRPTGFL
jgi:hypothetical protein